MAPHLLPCLWCHTAAQTGPLHGQGDMTHWLGRADACRLLPCAGVPSELRQVRRNVLPSRIEVRAGADQSRLMSQG